MVKSPCSDHCVAIFFFVCGGQELLNELASLIGIDKNISVSDLRAVCGLGYIRDIFGTYSGHMRDI